MKAHIAMERKSRILVVGATGNLGCHLVAASLAAGHPTVALVREASFSQPHRSQLLQSLSDAGAELVKGSLEDLPSLVAAVKQVDVVICAVPSKQALDQKLLVQAIKEAGCIKRFIPAEFGADPERVQIRDLDHGFYGKKAEIRHLVEREQIPHTYICCNYFADYLLPSLVQPNLQAPPRDVVTIFGDGNTKAVFVRRQDVASFTISTVDDPRTLNKVLYLRPTGNMCSLHELVEMWESKIGKKLERVYMSEAQVLQRIQDVPYPTNMELVFIYSAFIKGDHTYFDIEQFGLDGQKLYPHVNYTTVSEYLDTLV